jgi:CHAT domain-containing protein
MDLAEAREAAELRKIYELRNYYRDDCVDAAQSGVTRLDDVSKTTVIVYPIVLNDRIEILFSLPTGLKRFSVNIDKDTLTHEVLSYRKLLEKRTTREYLTHAQNIYNWLIRPMETDIKNFGIDTLVFVPDGPLRAVPMAALHDGHQYLIEKFAIAITPGLDLIDPKPISKTDREVIIFALTQPVGGFAPLPYIPSELEAIKRQYKTKTLLNQDFQAANIEQALREERYTILHIASHAQFGKDGANTFLLAHDEKLTIENLNNYIGLLQFRDEPLELLTLSACETAAGDDQAALGLAGVAIKAGARSAIATLWHINDLASSRLISEFYTILQRPGMSRAKALRQAQLRLIHDRRFQHPGYWSPFLLISDWL